MQTRLGETQADDPEVDPSKYGSISRYGEGAKRAAFYLGTTLKVATKRILTYIFLVIFYRIWHRQSTRNRAIIARASKARKTRLESCNSHRICHQVYERRSRPLYNYNSSDADLSTLTSSD